MPCRQLRWNELCGYLMKVYSGKFRQALLICFAIRRQTSFRIKKIYFYTIPLLRQQTRNGKGISAIVSGSGKYCERSFRIPTFGYCFRQCLRGAFHQVYGSNRLVLYRIGIQFFYLNGRKYFYHRSLFI